MKKIGILLFIILFILLIVKNEKDTYEDPIRSTDTPKKTYLDTPANTYKTRVEALKISNTIQSPANTYLNSRLNVRELAKKSLNDGNERIEKQNKAMEAFTK